MFERKICTLKETLLALLLAICGLVVGLIILFEHPDGMTWHDQQRLGQIAVAALAIGGILLLHGLNNMAISVIWICIFAGILGLGGVSAALSQHPRWAFAELALLVASVGISAFVYGLMQKFQATADWILAAFVRLLLACVVAQFYTNVASAFIHPELYFDPWILLNGFSNVRFQGQFLTLAVPLLCAAMNLPNQRYAIFPRELDYFLIASLSAMVFVAGTRGTVAAWLLISCIFWFGRNGVRRQSLMMFGALGVGYLLASLILHAISWGNGVAIEYRFAGQQLFGLSLREVLWSLAWKETLSHPWFGVGPMHFAALGNEIAGHPHQAILQIASEWGGAVLALTLVAVALWLRRVFVGALLLGTGVGADLRWALLYAVLAAIVQSMVDGVLVMPYPQIWLAIVVGWCAARCLQQSESSRVKVPIMIPLFIFGVAVAWLAALAINQYPSLLGQTERGGIVVRFWCDGRLR